MFLVFSNQSTGSRMLGQMLNSHRLVRFRFEPFATPAVLNRCEVLLNCELEEEIAQKSEHGVGIKYNQVTPRIIKWLSDVRPRVIHAYRENREETAASELLRRKYGGQKGFASPTEIQDIQDEIFRNEEAIDWMLAFLGIKPHRIIYEEITGGGDVREMPDLVARSLLEFLQLPQERLFCHIHKVHGTIEDKVVFHGRTDL